VKHSFIILISFLLLSPFLTSCEKYVGEYKDGKRNGQGTITWSDGNKYEGEWKDGEYHGQGTFSFDDGEEYVGIFKEGKPWNIIVFDSKQNIIGMWLNGLEE